MHKTTDQDVRPSRWLHRRRGQGRKRRASSLRRAGVVQGSAAKYSTTSYNQHHDPCPVEAPFGPIQRHPITNGNGRSRLQCRHFSVSCDAQENRDGRELDPTPAINAAAALGFKRTASFPPSEPLEEHSDSGSKSNAVTPHVLHLESDSLSAVAVEEHGAESRIVQTFRCEIFLERDNATHLLLLDLGAEGNVCLQGDETRDSTCHED